MKRTNPHIVALLFASFVLIAVAALYASMYHAVQTAVARVSVARADVAAQQYKDFQEKELSKTSGTTEALRSRIRSLFVDSGDEVAFIESLESLSTHSGATVTLSSIAADKVDPGKTGSMQVHVSSSGSWTSVMKVVKLSETLPYVVSVSHLRLDTSGIDDKRGSPTWHAEFDIRALIRTP